MKKVTHEVSDVNAARIIEFRRRLMHPGSATELVNGFGDLPFDVRRIYYIYDTPADAERGGHSHYAMQSVMVALSGSFDVVLDDGVEARRFTLNRPYQGLYIPAGIWRTVDNFSSGAVCLALASELFSEEDYVRDYGEFKHLTRIKRNEI